MTPTGGMLAVVEHKADGLLSTAGAADWLDVSTRTVQRLMHDGALPFVRVAGLRRIAVDDLRAYVERQRADITPTRRRARAV